MRCRSRATALAGSAAALVLTVLYLGTAAWIVLEQRWGPVVATISERHGMGVHSGDVVGVAAGVLGLGCALACAVLLGESLGRRRPQGDLAYRPTAR